MPVSKHRFKKHERLSSNRIIKLLSDKKSNKSVFVYPFILSHTEVDKNFFPAQAQILFSIPKKRIAKAVDRNLIKRRLREVYRKLKPELYEFLENRKLKVAFMVIYVGKDIYQYEYLKTRFENLIEKFMEAVD